MKSKDYIDGMREAAVIVAGHWNDSTTMTNQREQAHRSEQAILRKAKEYETATVESSAKTAAELAT